MLKETLKQKQKFVRKASSRIFVNRSLHLQRIKYYGFDMDYTLAQYKSPTYEILAFDLIKKKLIEMGYPAMVSTFNYDASFPIRGLWFDTKLGNLLKVDPWGNILICVHGFKFYKPFEIRSFYPNNFLSLTSPRIVVLNTLFSLPQIYMISSLIDGFDNRPELYVSHSEGYTIGNVLMTFKSIFNDVTTAIHYLHLHSDLKQITAENLELYIERNEKLPKLLESIRSRGSKTFLLTNSKWWYVKIVMAYLLETPDSPSWESYFDYIVVDASKPSFFEEGTAFRQIDKNTGKLLIGLHSNEDKIIYSGGSSQVLSSLMGAKGKDVLYFGDHIYGDVLKSKKLQGWRTVLLIPELNREVSIWSHQKTVFDELNDLDFSLGELYKNLNVSSTLTPDISDLRVEMQNVIRRMDESYGFMGSLFRSGSRPTFFSYQVLRYADLYASSVLNLLDYPLSYMFRCPLSLLPHESAVRQKDLEEQETLSFSSYHFDSSSNHQSPKKEKTVNFLVLSNEFDVEDEESGDKCEDDKDKDKNENEDDYYDIGK